MTISLLQDDWRPNSPTIEDDRESSNGPLDWTDDLCGTGTTPNSMRSTAEEFVQVACEWYDAGIGNPSQDEQ